MGAIELMFALGLYILTQVTNFYYTKSLNNKLLILTRQNTVGLSCTMRLKNDLENTSGWYFYVGCPAI